MTKLISSLFPAISEMTDEQLQQHIGDIRRRKYIERPAKVKHEKDAHAPQQKKAVSKVSKLLSSMSEVDREALIKQLEGL